MDFVLCMGSIKHIVLDLGGVIIDLDYNRSITSFEQLGIAEFANTFTKKQQASFFDAFDKGYLTPTAFRNEVRKLCSEPLSDFQIDSAWNSMLIGFPKHRVEFIRQISGKYPLYLLSNTNEIHITAVEEMLRSDPELRDFPEIFKKVYYSCRVGMRKPDREIFDFVLKENGLSADETLFVDDSPQHVRGAASSGYQAVHLDIESGDTLEEVLPKILSL